MREHGNFAETMSGNFAETIYLILRTQSKNGHRLLVPGTPRAPGFRMPAVHRQNPRQNSDVDIDFRAIKHQTTTNHTRGDKTRHHSRTQKTVKDRDETLQEVSGVLLVVLVLLRTAISLLSSSCDVSLLWPTINRKGTNQGRIET